MRLHGLRIDFANLLLFHIEEQVALPEMHQEEALLLRVIHVPRFWRLAIEFHDGESNGLPKCLFAGLQADTQGKTQQQYPGGGNQTAESPAIRTRLVTQSRYFECTERGGESRL